MDRVKNRSVVGNTVKAAIKIRPDNGWFNSQCFTVANVLKIIVFLTLCVFIYKKSTQSQQENDDSLLYLDLSIKSLPSLNKKMMIVYSTSPALKSTIFTF